MPNSGLALLNEVAQQYRDQGYRVIVGPRPPNLPPFLANFRPDLIAFGADENAVVDRTAYDLLAAAVQVRSALVHGYQPPQPPAPLVSQLISLVEDLLAGTLQPELVAAR